MIRAPVSSGFRMVAAAPRRASRLVVKAAMDPLPVRQNHSATIRSYLKTQNWENWWIDVVTDKIMKGLLRTTEGQVRAVVEYLTGPEVGMSTQVVCSMASIAPDMMAMSAENTRAVFNYLTSTRGLSHDDAKKVLAAHPKMLEYSPEGDSLAKPNGAMIKVDMVNGQINVAYFRRNARFNTAPITPFAPL